MLRLPHAGKAQLQFNIPTLNLSTLFAMSSDFTPSHGAELSEPHRQAMGCFQPELSATSRRLLEASRNISKHLEAFPKYPKIS